MADDADEDPIFRDMCVELAAVAIRCAARYAQTTGLELPFEDLLERVLRAAQAERHEDRKDGTIDLARARLARGMPVAAAMPPPITIESTLSFGRERASTISLLAQRLYGQADGTCIKRVLDAAFERGVSPLKAELGIK